MEGRRSTLAAIEGRLSAERRKLVYFGTRGADAETLLEIDCFQRAFSQIAPLSAVSVGECCLEELAGRRVDLNRYDIDQDAGEPVRRLRRELLRALETPSAVFPYRPTALLASAWFPRAEFSRYLGPFHELQRCLEHKPWVEQHLKSAGIPVLPWRYYADDEMSLLSEGLSAGPLVVRSNRTDGGAGVRLVRTPQDLHNNLPSHGDGFLAACPLLEPSVPLNVNGCVFPDGRVALHGASLQLIGIGIATGRRFGYCGNDFARTKDLEPRVLEALGRLALSTGRWLHGQGYLGAFGVDALLYDGTVYLVEINPRFQGSSLPSAYIDRAIGRADQFMNHIAAFLRFECSDGTPLPDLVRDQPAVAHVVLHNRSGREIVAGASPVDQLPLRCRLLPEPGTVIEPEAIVFQAMFDRPVTIDGTSLLPEAASLLQAVTEKLGWLRTEEHSAG